MGACPRPGVNASTAVRRGLTLPCANGWFAWRWWYYGYPFPNTYYVKAAGEPPPGYRSKLMQNGLYYVWQWARQRLPPTAERFCLRSQ